MPVSNNNYHKPEEALHELMLQETIINVAVDVQALLRLLVDKGIVSKREINKYRVEVRNSPKYKLTIDTITKEKLAFKTAQDNPEEYLKAIFNAKMDRRIK